MITTAKAAAEIRATLKREHGWTSRQVSVRAHNYSLGSTIRVMINDPAIPLAIVKRVAEAPGKKKNARVTVCYAPEALRVIVRRYPYETITGWDG